MPRGLFQKFNDLLKSRKPMDSRRKKKNGTHFTAAPGVDKDSVAGTMRRRNQKKADMMDKIDDY